jgi:hypothetical protein
MSNTKRKPLLSENQVFGKPLDGLDEGMNRSEIYEAYEAARAKDAELIQQLLDGLHKVATLADVDTDDRSTIARDPLYAAEAAGYKPSDQ